MEVKKSSKTNSQKVDSKKSVPLNEYIQQTKGEQIARGMEASKERKKRGQG